MVLVPSGCGGHPGLVWQNSGGAFCLPWTPPTDAGDGIKVLVIRRVYVERQNLWWRGEQQSSAQVSQGYGQS